MLQPLSPPSQTTNPGGLGCPVRGRFAAATAVVNQVSVADLISSLPNAVSGACLPSHIGSRLGRSNHCRLSTPCSRLPFVVNHQQRSQHRCLVASTPPSLPRYSCANALNRAPVAIAEGAIEAAEVPPAGRRGVGGLGDASAWRKFRRGHPGLQRRTKNEPRLAA